MSEKVILGFRWTCAHLSLIFIKGHIVSRVTQILDALIFSKKNVRSEIHHGLLSIISSGKCLAENSGVLKKFHSGLTNMVTDACEMEEIS